MYTNKHVTIYIILNNTKKSNIFYSVFSFQVVLYFFLTLYTTINNTNIKYQENCFQIVRIC